MKHRHLILVFAIAALLPLSCKPQPSGNNHTSSQATEKKTRAGVLPAKDDTLILTYNNDPNTINPITANDTTSGSFMQWVYDNLAEQSFQNPDEWVPMLAERWEFDEKTLEFTIHLRHGVRWHPMSLPDGTPLGTPELTADDVKFTFDCILNKHVGAAHIRSYYEDPEAKEEADRIKIVVSVVDRYTIKVKWKKPYFQALEFTMGIGPIPKHVYSVNERGEPISFDFTSKEFAEGFNKHWAGSGMCGTGPMRFVEWKKSERVVLERNPDYWGPPFYFSRVVFRSISNPNTALQLLLQNDVDEIGISEKDLYFQTADDPSVKSGKVRLFEYEYPAYRYLGYNLQRDLFKDKRVRWALGHAIPVDDIIKKILRGMATRLTGPFLPGSSAYLPELKPIPYDLDRARALLKEAGWTDTNNNGVRDRLINDVRVEAKFDLMINADIPSFRTMAEVIKDNFRQIGVDVQISPAKWALLLEKLDKKEFDAVIVGWALGWKQDPYQIWHGSQADIPDSSNYIGYKNPELDKAIETLRVTFDLKKQTELYHQIHRLIYDDQPYTFLYVDKATAGRHARLQNVNFYKIRPCIDVREWTASTARVLSQ